MIKYYIGLIENLQILVALNFKLVFLKKELILS